MSTAVAFASAADALEMVRAGLRFVAAADATTMTAAERAACLRGLERADAVATAARTSVLGAFGAGQDYVDDGDYSPFSWLRHRTRVTRGTAAEHTGWVKRAAAHPASRPRWPRRRSRSPMRGRSAGGPAACPRMPGRRQMRSCSARRRPGWSWRTWPRWPRRCTRSPARTNPTPAADGDGAGRRDPGDGFDDRAVKLATTFGGAGVIHGDLTPECAEFVQTVLDALSAPAGADDGRTQEQRYHDALQEAMRRLLAAGLLPERSGQPVKAWAYISLADLMLIEGSSALLGEWTQDLRARWAGHRAAAAEAGGHQGLWLDGDARRRSRATRPDPGGDRGREPGRVR